MYGLCTLYHPHIPFCGNIIDMLLSKEPMLVWHLKYENVLNSEGQRRLKLGVWLVLHWLAHWWDWLQVIWALFLMKRQHIQLCWNTCCHWQYRYCCSEQICRMWYALPVLYSWLSCSDQVLLLTKSTALFSYLQYWFISFAWLLKLMQAVVSFSSSWKCTLWWTKHC